MTTYRETMTFYEASGVAFAATIEADESNPDAVVPTFTGGTAEVWSRSAGGTVLQGTATITGAQEVTCSFAAFVLAPGVYTLEVLAAPPATDLRVVGMYTARVVDSIKPAP